MPTITTSIKHCTRHKSVQQGKKKKLKGYQLERELSSFVGEMIVYLINAKESQKELLEERGRADKRAGCGLAEQGPTRATRGQRRSRRPWSRRPAGRRWALSLNAEEFMWISQSSFARKDVVTMATLLGRVSAPSAGGKSTTKQGRSKFRRIGNWQSDFSGRRKRPLPAVRAAQGPSPSHFPSLKKRKPMRRSARLPQ